MSAIVLSYFTSFPLDGVFGALMSIQTVLYLPIIHLNIPSIVNAFFEIMIPISTFDPYPDTVLNYLHENIFDFKETSKEPSNTDFGKIGFDNRNSIIALGGNFILIILYFVIAFISLFLSLGCLKKIKLVQKVKNKINMTGKHTQILSRYII